VLPLTGWLSTLFGRKRFYMTCVAIFTVSSFFCGTAPTLGFLVFFRVLQGAGGGALQPVAQAILAESFPPERRGMAMAIYGMGVVVAPIVGPTLGGWITDNYSWHWIFFINIPVGLLSLALNYLLLFDPPYLKRKSLREGVHIDFIGLGLLGVGLGFLQVVLDKGQREDWFGSDFIVSCSILAAIGLIGALFWELRKDDPIVDLRILRDRNFALATVTMFTLGVVLYGSIVLLPIFLQTLMGYTATQSGLVLSPGALVSLVMLPIVGHLLRTREPRQLIMLGLVITSLSLFYMANFNLDIDFRTAVLARVVQGFGLVFLFVPINTMAFHFIPKHKINNATGLINLARNIGGSFGIAAVTTLLARRAQFHQSVLVSHLTPLDFGYQAALQRATAFLIQQGSSAVQAATQAQALLYGSLTRQSMALAFVDNFWLLAVVTLVLVPLPFFLKKTRSGKGPETVA
jgi:DHA2 family multidrug resistance protein